MIMMTVIRIIAIAYFAVAIYGKGIEDGKAKFCQQSPTQTLKQ